ncbi:Sodium-coupled neutral amino acid transporter 2 [Seminavis robusta]|uniref:Sodium-coupled neutral amino acid transporter 2 n=1 Tax=Seminavis robusta TaxID=568900 RepID=A0A9N8HMW6_9STRA|nr:Sodium-coupled neutral amino acid transporter 2 [Seminavis robusta]|eukprot:Sro936_g222080.1 Sodium-coupled neutral amino acid transporter 2 (437) ;mRNA; r:20267-21577
MATEETSLLQGNNNDAGRRAPSNDEQQGSSIFAAAMNFANSIVGAGCIGLGSAIARSGGLAAIFAIIFLAILTKFSFDLVIELSIETGGSYEQLGSYTYGTGGRILVMISKFLFAYGCMVAYIKIVKDNFPSAMLDMTGWALWEPNHANWVTICLSAMVMLPLSLLRDMTPLERVSIVKFATLLAMLCTIFYLYPANHISSVDQQHGMWVDHWFVVQPGIVAGLGTLVFTFVAQHTVNLVFDSLRPNLQNMVHWKVVSTWSVILAATFSSAIGLAIYVTFWDRSSSNIFVLYAPSLPLSITKLLLSCMIMLTYPMPFLSCRELLILSIPQQSAAAGGAEQPWWLLEPKQLIPPLHVLLTVCLWASSAILAVLVPSLADVLDLTGCVAGTAIAFVLPAMFSFKLHGYNHLAAFILLVGGTIGLVGTVQSLRKLIQDV